MTHPPVKKSGKIHFGPGSGFGSKSHRKVGSRSKRFGSTTLHKAAATTHRPVDGTAAVEMLLQLLGGGGIIHIANVDAPRVHLHLFVKTQVHVPARWGGRHWQLFVHLEEDVKIINRNKWCLFCAPVSRIFIRKIRIQIQPFSLTLLKFKKIIYNYSCSIVKKWWI